MKSIQRILLVVFLMTFSVFHPVAYAENKVSAENTATTNPLVKFLKEVQYTTRLKFEYDDNIFLREADEESDSRNVFMQSLSYKLPKDNYYFQWGYTGNYAYYSQEAVGVLGHSANVLYSYRPFDGFSIGLRDDYNWLQDSKVTTTLGDRVLALGYVQNMPTLQVKYELSPRVTVSTDMFYQFLDVRSSSNDDYIDNKQLGVKTQMNYNITPQGSIVGFVGFGHRQISFGQIAEKAAVSQRPYAGFTKRFPNLFNFTTEVGFANTDMEDENNSDDDNVDFKASIETIFSIFTKLTLGFRQNVKEPSLRSQYTQYATSAASFNISHTINPKTALRFDYTFEKQNFDSSDVLVGVDSVDRSTAIHEIGVTLSRKLNAWLTCDANYDYTKRNTDFVQESYTNNRFSISLTARY